MSQIILASASPRRRELLEQAGIAFEVCPAQGEEIAVGTSPQSVVEELSRQKAEEVASAMLAYRESHPDLVTPEDFLVIGADTVVALDGRILGKPKDEEAAASMLEMLAGRTHGVYTGVALVFVDKSGRTGEHVFHEKTEVDVCPMTREEIARYVAGGEPMDKAGAYGIQGSFAIHVRGIRGDYCNVVGLPLSRLYQELMRIGFPVW